MPPQNIQIDVAALEELVKKDQIIIALEKEKAVWDAQQTAKRERFLKSNEPIAAQIQEKQTKISEIKGEIKKLKGQIRMNKLHGKRSYKGLQSICKRIRRRVDFIKRQELKRLIIETRTRIAQELRL